jgi:hypothetical protein
MDRALKRLVLVRREKRDRLLSHFRVSEPAIFTKKKEVSKMDERKVSEDLYAEACFCSFWFTASEGNREK